MQNDQTVQLIRERNEKGMQSLLKHYGPLMRYVAEPILENASDCEELLQDVALRVWERIDRYDEAKASFSTWVTTITRNAALDKLKRRRETESYEALSDQIPAESGDPEAEVRGQATGMRQQATGNEALGIWRAECRGRRPRRPLRVGRATVATGRPEAVPYGRTAMRWCVSPVA